MKEFKRIRTFLPMIVKINEEERMMKKEIDYKSEELVDVGLLVNE